MEIFSEESFVQTFIREGRRERLLHELTSPKKRYRGLDRFCHRSGDLVDPRRILAEGENLETTPEFLSFVKKHNGLCTVWSPDGNLDGLVLPFEDAVMEASVNADAVIIMGGDYAVVFGEAMKGGRDKYLLSVDAW